jgi:hypothetical protein
MTTVALSSRGAARSLPVAVVLGAQEGRRIVLHPLGLLAAALSVLLIVSEGDNGPRAAFETTSVGPIFWYGVFIYFAAYLVASRDRRAHSGELLAPLPRGGVDRVAALCVAALAPAIACLAFVLVVDQLQAAQGAYVVRPDVWHLLQSPLTVLGGALLGIMVARLTRLPGVALLVMVAMVVVNVWLNGRPTTLQPLATFVPWAVYGETMEQWAGFHPGSPAWHDAYLVALSAMAATGAFLREADDRFRVLCIGGLFTSAAVVTGILQLP